MSGNLRCTVGMSLQEIKRKREGLRGEARRTLKAVDDQ